MTPIKNNSNRTPNPLKGGTGHSTLRSVQIGVKPFAILALATLSTIAVAHAKPPKLQQDVEWLWQYTPDQANPNGRENQLVLDLRFKPFLDQTLTAPQTFWGQPIAGRWRSLANTALDHLSVPDKVLADDNRYIAISGCTVHFCPDRGLLWVDLNGSHHLVVFCAIDWTKQGAPTSDPDAQYTVYCFSNDPLGASGPAKPAASNPTAAASSAADLHLPPALTKAIGRWAAEPLAGSKIVQRITRAIVTDPNGTEQEAPPSALGIAPVMHTVPTGAPTSTPDNNAAPADDSTPVLKPRK